MSNLAGMFPPTATVQNTTTVFDLWQPIPVHSRPREEDPVGYNLGHLAGNFIFFVLDVVDGSSLSHLRHLL